MTVVADIVNALRPQYLRSRRKDLASIPALLASGNFDRLRIMGHNIKGSGSAYGFPELSALGAALETAARRQDSLAISGLTTEFKAMLTPLPVSLTKDSCREKRD